MATTPLSEVRSFRTELCAYRPDRPRRRWRRVPAHLRPISTPDPDATAAHGNPQRSAIAQPRHRTFRTLARQSTLMTGTLPGWPGDPRASANLLAHRLHAGTGAFVFHSPPTRRRQNGAAPFLGRTCHPSAAREKRVPKGMASSILPSAYASVTDGPTR